MKLSRAVVVAGVAYVTTHHATDADAGGTVYALDASDGTSIWRAATDRETGSIPVVVDGVVHVTLTDLRNEDKPGEVIALDADDGSVAWRYVTHAWSVSAPVVVDGLAYVGTRGDAGFPDGIVYALDARDGSEVWRYQTDDEGVPPPVVVDGVAYVGSGDAVHAFDAHGNGDANGSGNSDGEDGGVLPIPGGRVTGRDANGWGPLGGLHVVHGPTTR